MDLDTLSELARIMTDQIDIVKLASQINSKLVTHSAKDWHYSRITLVTKDLSSFQSPYVLWVDTFNPQDPAEKKELKSLVAEVKWGTRHSHELGILELISLRLNKALLETTTDAD
ncbi:MAG: hypothetical protein GTO40_01580, partial [Deltaproteobacteria bacterium]|nr:hypothetical protein [Deltaproteobacteria bacterium]